VHSSCWQCGLHCTSAVCVPVQGTAGYLGKLEALWQELCEKAPRALTVHNIANYAAALAQCGNPTRALEALRYYLLPSSPPGPSRAHSRQGPLEGAASLVSPWVPMGQSQVQRRGSDHSDSEIDEEMARNHDMEASAGGIHPPPGSGGGRGRIVQDLPEHPSSWYTATDTAALQAAFHRIKASDGVHPGAVSELMHLVRCNACTVQSLLSFALAASDVP
jgi:hypothetical protein